MKDKTMDNVQNYDSYSTTLLVVMSETSDSVYRNLHVYRSNSLNANTLWTRPPAYSDLKLVSEMNTKDR
jgi:hypothetical protein